MKMIDKSHPTDDSHQSTAEPVPSETEGAVVLGLNSFNQGTASAVPKNPPYSGVLTPEVGSTISEPGSRRKIL
jgi:hypothetical protein